MLYSMFIYQENTGIMMWEKSLAKELDSKSEVFSSFFSAIQNFVKQMVLNETNDQGLEAIDLGKYLVNINKVPALKIDLVIIAHKNDEKEVHKFIPKMIKILKNHRELFEAWNGDQSRFNVLDVEVIKILRRFKRLSGKESEESDSHTIEELIDKLPEMEKDQTEKYLQEKQYLEQKLMKTTSYYRKLEIINSIEDICNKIGDKSELEQINRMRTKILRDIKDVKQKLAYYLSQTKLCISSAVESARGKSLFEIDFKDAYLNLYSFSTKLKFLGRNDLSTKYREWAKSFIEKPPELKPQFSSMIQNVLKLPDNVDNYISNH